MEDVGDEVAAEEHQREMHIYRLIDVTTGGSVKNATGVSIFHNLNVAQLALERYLERTRTEPSQVRVAEYTLHATGLVYRLTERLDLKGQMFKMLEGV